MITCWKVKSLFKHHLRRLIKNCTFCNDDLCLLLRLFSHKLFLDLSIRMEIEICQFRIAVYEQMHNFKQCLFIRNWGDRAAPIDKRVKFLFFHHSYVVIMFIQSIEFQLLEIPIVESVFWAKITFLLLSVLRLWDLFLQVWITWSAIYSHFGWFGLVKIVPTTSSYRDFTVIVLKKTNQTSDHKNDIQMLDMQIRRYSQHIRYLDLCNHVNHLSCFTAKQVTNRIIYWFRGKHLQVLTRLSLNSNVVNLCKQNRSWD